MIAIIDYGLGNLHSVLGAVRKVGYDAIVTNDALEIQASDKIILPGVGAYPKAMRLLGEYGLINFIKSKAKNNLPILGICLGMQLLGQSSDEDGFTEGLKIIPIK